MVLVLALGAAGIALLLGALGLYKHFVTDRIMDGGNMENPDAMQYHMLDGDFTCVDNDKLWRRIAGAWRSEDGRWELTLDGEYDLSLTLDGEEALSCPLRFTYLQPGKVFYTELEPEETTLRRMDGTELGAIRELCHNEGDGGDDVGTITLKLMLPDDTEKSVELCRAEQEPQSEATEN